MNKSAKTILFALFLSVIPVRIWAQDGMSNHAVIESRDANTTQNAHVRDYENGFLFNVFEIANVEERIQLASALATSDIWLCNPTNNPGELYIRPNSFHADIPIYAEFDYLRMTLREEYEEALLLPKEEFGEIVNSWAHNISNEYYNFLTSDHLDRANHCMDAEPFCTSDVYNFPALNSGYSWSGPNYGCLGSSPTTHHSFWYYMRIGVAGNITIKIEANFDVDFALWGPFNNQTDPCPTSAGQAGLLTATCSSCPNNTSSSANYPYGNLHDCSFDARHYEYAHVVNGQVGQYFILLITNWSGSDGSITFQKYAGDGETDCGILPPLVNNEGPYCVGETIHLTANGQAGATYNWSGPGGFSSTQQNPTRPNCTMNMAGAYTCTISVGSQSNSATTNVVVHPQPTANFNFTTVCLGESTQFTNTSTTSPSGQSMSYLWNFGGGQTSTQQNPTFTFTTAGSHSVSLTVTCNGHCTSTRTQSVTVYANPAADAGPDQTIPYGSSTQLSGSGGVGTFNYHWEPASMVTNANSQNPQTVVLTQDQTYTLTVTNPQGQCVDTDQVTIHIEGSAMTVTACDDISICQGGSGQIYVNAGGGTGNLSYSWTPTTGLSNPNISNPIASPSETTTYTCHVTDGQTSQNVSVTVTVNEVIVEHEEMTICSGDSITWHGDDYSEVGTYPFDTVTDQGCDKTIYLHLDHYPTYSENETTPIVVERCYGESYTFNVQGHNDTYTQSIETTYTLQTIHGCDSIVRLRLTVWPENELETLPPVSRCPDNLPYVFEGVSIYEPGTYPFTLQDSHGCPKPVQFEFSVTPYSTINRTEYVGIYSDTLYNCYIPEVDTIITYHSGGTHIDTLPTAPCESIFTLNLNFCQIPETTHIYDTACDTYDWYVNGEKVGGPYDHSCTDSYSIPLYFNPDNPDTQIMYYDPNNPTAPPIPCTKNYKLHLIVYHKNLSGQPEHLDDFISKCDSISFDWFGETVLFKENGIYRFPNDTLDGHTTHGCDTLMTVTVAEMKYTPYPDDFGPSAYSTAWFSLPEDPNEPDTAMCAAVVTNTEFFSFQYDFYVNEIGNSVWDECEWNISKPSWQIVSRLSADQKSSFCTVYVADRDEGYVKLTATARNSCGEKTKTFYLKSSFLDVGENELEPANVNIVPNPNNGQMHLDFENMVGRTSVKVFDMTGNQIDAFETTINSNRYNYDYNMKRYAEGIYFFVVSNNNRVLTKKVVVIH